MPFFETFYYVAHLAVQVVYIIIFKMCVHVYAYVYIFYNCLQDRVMVPGTSIWMICFILFFFFFQELCFNHSFCLKNDFNHPYLYFCGKNNGNGGSHCVPGTVLSTYGELTQLLFTTAQS
jgi:hypothetical protein